MKANIISSISQIKPIDPIETADKQDALDWLDHGDSFYRQNNPDKHLVSYCVVYDRHEKKILLVEHKKAKQWLPAGGHVEIDEDPFTTAKRELSEELSLTLEPLSDEPLFITVRETQNMKKAHTDVSLWFVFLGDSRKPFVFDTHEMSSVRWFSLKEVPMLFNKDPNLERFIAKLLASMDVSVS